MTIQPDWMSYELPMLGVGLGLVLYGFAWLSARKFRAQTSSRASRPTEVFSASHDKTISESGELPSVMARGMYPDMPSDRRSTASALSQDGSLASYLPSRRNHGSSAGALALDMALPTEDLTLDMSVAEAISIVYSPQPQFTAHSFRSGWTMKRVLDVFISVVALLILSPVLFVIALIIYASDGRAPISRQKRLGRYGRPFGLLKFRTMVVDGELVLARHLAENPKARDEWAKTHKLTSDPRVTTIGRILRKFGLDVLPQLWNVLRGEMSLVGPRPIVPAEVIRYERSFSTCFAVPPGMTGLWQVSGRSDTTYAERVALDLDYATRWTLRRDLAIILRTIPAILSQRGAR